MVQCGVVRVVGVWLGWFFPHIAKGLGGPVVVRGEEKKSA